MMSDPLYHLRIQELAQAQSELNTLENQQNNPIPALVEKITNSLDAILLNECKKRGIDPKSKEAPKRMSAAVEKFFGIRNGDFSEVIKTKRRENTEKKEREET